MGLAWCLGGGNLKEKKDHQVRCPKAHSYPKLPASTLKRNLAWMVREDGSKGFHGNQKISHPKVVLHPSASEGSLHQPVRCVCGGGGGREHAKAFGQVSSGPWPQDAPSASSLSLRHPGWPPEKLQQPPDNCPPSQLPPRLQGLKTLFRLTLQPYQDTRVYHRTLWTLPPPLPLGGGAGRSWRAAAQVARQDERAGQGGASGPLPALHPTRKAISCFPITSFLSQTHTVAHSLPSQSPETGSWGSFNLSPASTAKCAHQGSGPNQPEQELLQDLLVHCHLNGTAPPLPSQTHRSPAIPHCQPPVFPLPPGTQASGPQPP